MTTYACIDDKRGTLHGDLTLIARDEYELQLLALLHSKDGMYPIPLPFHPAELIEAEYEYDKTDLN